jgi:Phosphotransferase enzyme family
VPDDDLAALLEASTERVPLEDVPGKSGARLERVVIGGQRYVLKHLDRADDWTMRASGCLGGPPLALWRLGILSRLPDCFNQPIVAVAARDGGCSVLMHDVSPWLVPVTDDRIEPAQHTLFVEHMAALHAAFWGGGPELEVVPVMHRYLELSPWTALAEASTGDSHLVPELIGKGWPLLAEVAPEAAEIVTPLAYDPGPLVDALAATPQTFVHSNWKLDNLGTDDQDRTVIIDWEQPGRGAALSDLAWYLAINCRRLPSSKEASIELYRQSLERSGIDTAPWWDRQLALALLGALVQFGWEKALGGYDEELAWWESKARAAVPLLP